MTRIVPAKLFASNGGCIQARQCQVDERLDVEDLLAERGITVTYEAIRQWCLRLGLDYARRLRHRRGRQGGTWHLDELFIRI